MEVNESITSLGMIPHIRSRGEEIIEKKKNKTPKRWVIERTMSWVNQYRKLRTRWERKIINYEALCHFAFAVMIFGKIDVLG